MNLSNLQLDWMVRVEHALLAQLQQLISMNILIKVAAAAVTKMTKI